MKPKLRQDAHIFAIFAPVEQRGNTVAVHDPETITRIASILRLRVGETIIFFDRNTVFHAILHEITKKQIVAEITAQEPVVPLQPAVVLVLPLLERDALEEVVYKATAFGVSAIELIITEKSRRVFGVKDLARLNKIAIAAAEQAKQYALPTIYAQVQLTDFLEEKITHYYNYQKLWCDVAGQPVLQAVRAGDNKIIIVGPEGDFTSAEKDMLRQNFTAIKLTPTVLRARDAAALVLGILRLGQ